MILKASLLAIVALASVANGAATLGSNRRLKSGKPMKPSKVPKSAKKVKESKKIKSSKKSGSETTVCTRNTCDIDLCVSCSIQIDDNDEEEQGCLGYEGKLTVSERQCSCNCVTQLRFIYHAPLSDLCNPNPGLTPTTYSATLVGNQVLPGVNSITLVKLGDKTVQDDEEIVIEAPDGICLSDSDFLAFEVGCADFTFYPSGCTGTSTNPNPLLSDKVGEDGIFEFSGFSCSDGDGVTNNCRQPVRLSYSVENLGNEERALSDSWAYGYTTTDQFGAVAQSPPLTLTGSETLKDNFQFQANVCQPFAVVATSEYKVQDDSSCPEGEIEKEFGWGEFPILV